MGAGLGHGHYWDGCQKREEKDEQSWWERVGDAPSSQASSDQVPLRALSALTSRVLSLLRIRKGGLEGRALDSPQPSDIFLCLSPSWCPALFPEKSLEGWPVLFLA